MSTISLNVPRRATPAIVVPHQAWRQSRSALLEAACTGPATLALLGAPGTGKSWLLRHLEATLRKHGQAVTLLRQGDLPWQLTPGTVLLVDEASRLNEHALTVLMAQRTTIVILADLPKFADTLARQVAPPPITHLHAIGASQVEDFVAQWLHLADRERQIVTASAIERLAVHSGGTARLITGLLNAALALSSGSPVTGAVIDEVASLRWSGGTALPSVSEPPPNPTYRRAARAVPRTPPRARARRAAALATFAALASASLLTLRSAATSAPRPSREIVAALVPPPLNAALASIVLAEAAAPELAMLTAPASSTPSPITLLEAAPASLTKLPLPPTSAPQTAMPSEFPVADRDLDLPSASDPAPGLILIARRGDTLRELYASLYRGVEAPPYEDVVAVNPRPVVPGTVVIFPAPLGGWPRR